MRKYANVQIIGKGEPFLIDNWASRSELGKGESFMRLRLMPQALFCRLL